MKIKIASEPQIISNSLRDNVSEAFTYIESNTWNLIGNRKPDDVKILAKESENESMRALTFKNNSNEDKLS